MLQAWQRANVMTWAGYILGFPTDTPEIDRPRHRDHQARTADRHPRVLLPHPAAGLRGPQEPSRSRGSRMEPDMNNYDLEHVCTAHPIMSADAWRAGLSRRLGALLHRRACRDGAAPRGRQPASIRSKIVDAHDRLLRRLRASRACIRCSSATSGARCAPSAATACRSSIRSLFYPWRAYDFLKVAAQWLRARLTRYRAIQRRVLADPAARELRRRRAAASRTDGAVRRRFRRGLRRQDPRHLRRAEAGERGGGRIGLAHAKARAARGRLAAGPRGHGRRDAMADERLAVEPAESVGMNANRLEADRPVMRATSTAESTPGVSTLIARRGGDRARRAVRLARQGSRGRR